MHAGAEGSGADHVTRADRDYVGENRGNPYAVRPRRHRRRRGPGDRQWAARAARHGVVPRPPDRLQPGRLRQLRRLRRRAATSRLSAILHVTLTLERAPSSARTSPRSCSHAVGSAARRSHARRPATFVNQLSRTDFGASAALIERRAARSSSRPPGARLSSPRPGPGSRGRARSRRPCRRRRGRGLGPRCTTYQTPRQRDQREDGHRVRTRARASRPSARRAGASSR